MLNNPNAETSENHVVIESNVNVTSPLIDDLSTSANSDNIRALNFQLWLIANSAVPMLTYNPPSGMSTTSSLDARGVRVTPVIAETELPFIGPRWPIELNSESLVSELIARPSNIYVRIKRHTCSVQKFMHFLSNGASSMPKGLGDVYNELK